MLLLANNLAYLGTTWATEIVRNIFYINDKDLLQKAKRLHAVLSYLEYGPGSESNNVNGTVTFLGNR